jgi:hypothetical protein
MFTLVKIGVPLNFIIAMALLPLAQNNYFQLFAPTAHWINQESSSIISHQSAEILPDFATFKALIIFPIKVNPVAVKIFKQGIE